jgi:hypothetical protein
MLKKILIGITAGLLWAVVSFIIDYFKLPDYLRELIFFACGFFYCAYIIDEL